MANWKAATRNPRSIFSARSRTSAPTRSVCQFLHMVTVPVALVEGSTPRFKNPRNASRRILQRRETSIRFPVLARRFPFSTLRAAVPPEVARLAGRIPGEASSQKKDMSDTPKNNDKPKASYQPPQVVRVHLRPEEAVLGHCKVPGIAGPVSSGCGSAFSHCRTFGS